LVEAEGWPAGAAREVIGGNSSRLRGLQDILEGASKGQRTKGRSLQFEKSGGIDQAYKDFQKLGVSEIRDISTGKIGKLPDGRIVNVRAKSSAKVPTLEIYTPQNKSSVKFRYKE